jgi:predicted anti-sigma-YlaC factor YlaD
MSVKTITMKIMFRMLGIPTCEEMDQFIYDYLEGKLDKETTKSIEKHLRFCVNCKRFISSYRRLVKGTKLIPPPSIEPVFKERMYEFIIKNKERLK